jgi:hypothetical protein
MVFRRVLLPSVLLVSTLLIFSGSGLAGNEVVGITKRVDSRLSLAFCDGCMVYERGEVYLIGYGNASIDVDGKVVWTGVVNGSDKVHVVLPAGIITVSISFGDDLFVYDLKVKNRSVESTAVEEFGEVVPQISMTELELLMEIVKVHGVSIFFFVLACPLMFWIVKRAKEMEIVEAV